MIVTLTDFGSSEYLGVMKGVILYVCPRARIVDLYNDVRPQSVKEAAWILLKSYRYFPKGSIFLCVVDPGVGSERQALAVKTKNYFFVGPDNGLLYPTVAEDGVVEAVSLPVAGASFTFHGRDVFAKAAASLECGRAVKELGESYEIKNKLAFYLRGRVGEVVRIDNFGNVVTNVPAASKTVYKVKLSGGTKKMDLYKTYDAAPDHKLFLIVGSANTLEISVKNKSAAQSLRANVGERVEID
jgi:hypothetical protein